MSVVVMDVFDKVIYLVNQGGLKLSEFKSEEGKFGNLNCGIGFLLPCMSGNIVVLQHGHVQKRLD